MSNRSAKLHTFERCIQRLQAHFGVTQTLWFWIQQYNAVMYRSEKTQPVPLLLDVTGNALAGAFFLTYAHQNAILVTEIEICKMLHLNEIRFHHLLDAIHNSLCTHAAKPFPYEQARQYIMTLSLPEITPTIRQHALQLFIKHGPWMCRKSFKPIFIALAIYRYLETLYPDVNFRLYRVAEENGVGISRMYAISHLLCAKIQEQMPSDSISFPITLLEPNKLV